MDKNQIQVLLIEDNLTDAILLREALGADALTAFDVTVVERLQSAVEILQGHDFDIILLDLGLPDGHGLETFTRIHQVVPQIPKVILSGLSDETVAMQSVHAGAQDYLVKGATGFASAARAIRYALERQQAQVAVRASEERFRAMIENGLDDISLLDAEGRLIWESPAVVRNLGYAENEFVGRSLFELVHPDDLGWIRGLFLKLLQEPQHRQEGIGRLRHADGSWHWIEAIVTNLLANPSVQAIVVNYRDITERRQAEARLRENAEDEALINSLNDAANRGESLESLVRLLGEKFKDMFYARGTGLYLLGEDGRSLNMPGFSLPEGVIGNLEKLIGRHIPPLKIPIRDGGIFQRFLQNPGGSILTDPQEIQQWMTEFTGVETVPAGLDMVVSKLIPHFYQILGIGSTISLPLISSGRTVGLLGISSANMLSQKELERLRKIGVQLASAIQRKQDEQRLSDSNERFEQLANNIEEAFWITRAQTREEIYLSPAAEKIWGLPIEELQKPNAFRTYILPDDLPIVEAALARQRQGEKTEIEYRITRPNGSIHWIWDRSFPIHASDGKLLSNAGLSTDITEIKEAQSELELLNRTLETRVLERTAEVQDLYDKAPCGYQSLDENGVFVNVNQTEMDWFGYSREELIGIRTFSDLLTPQSQQLFAQCFPLFKEQGWIKDVEFDVIRKDGHILPVLLNATAVYDGNGKFLQSRTTMFDITDRRKAEIALLRSRDDLSAANVALERAARLKDEFMANMSHELRTPLNAILGLSESLNEQVAGPLNEKQQRYIQTINESGRHLLQLINDILDLAKIEAGQIVLHIGRVDLRAVCESSLVLVKQLAHRKNQHIEYQMDDSIKYILADERSLKQMLVNLLSNAIKFTAEGEKLGLMVQLDKAEKKVLLTVWDNGIGITETDLKRLFKPFVQLNAGLTRETSGTGLGLALVASMARLHGGSVGVESHPGQGSRFTIALPWESVVETDSLSKLKISSKFRAINPNAPRQTILLVEDTDAVIMLVKDFLELAGYNVEVARNGYDGITLAEKIHPSLILMDVQMPGMDGLETARRIRENPVIKGIPIIALTALAMPGDRMRCLEAGMDEYISKPINLNSFTKTIDRLLQAQQERKPS